MLAHEGTQISLLLLGHRAVQAKSPEDVLLASIITAVGGGGSGIRNGSIADGTGQLFVLLFGGHLTQHRSWREGKRSRGRSVLMLMVLGVRGWRRILLGR